MWNYFVNTLRIYRWSAWIYHHGPGDLQSPLTDSEFDRIEAALGLPKELGHAVVLTEAEQSQAISWAMNHAPQATTHD